MKKLLIVATLSITVAAVIKRVTGKMGDYHFVIPRSNDNHLKMLNQISSRATS